LLVNATLWPQFRDEPQYLRINLVNHFRGVAIHSPAL
jgi:hypothetical protein